MFYVASVAFVINSATKLKDFYATLYGIGLDHWGGECVSVRSEQPRDCPYEGFARFGTSQEVVYQEREQS